MLISLEREIALLQILLQQKIPFRKLEVEKVPRKQKAQSICLIFEFNVCKYGKFKYR